MKSIHLKESWPCTWPGCSQVCTTKQSRDAHRIRVHTHEWSYECNICLGRDVWWGCITPGEFRKHMQVIHPEEWDLQEEETAARCPYVCANNRCCKRFETQIECERHMMKMH